MGHAQSTYNQPPTVGKTPAIFVRSKEKPGLVSKELNPDLKESDVIFYIKVDGTGAILIITSKGECFLLKRCDIKSDNTPSSNKWKGKKGNTEPSIKTLNHNRLKNLKPIDNPADLNLVVPGFRCRVETIIRLKGTEKIEVPIYLFELDEKGLPIEDHNHYVGFTPVDVNFPDDKHLAKAIVTKNGSPDLVLRVGVFDGSPIVKVMNISAKELLGGNFIMSFEIMGKALNNRYDYVNPDGTISVLCFCVPHNSLVIKGPSLDFKSVEEFFYTGPITATTADSEKLRCIEGLIVVDANGKKFKIHWGHLGKEELWKQRTSSGLKFVIQTDCENEELV